MELFPAFAPGPLDLQALPADGRRAEGGEDVGLVLMQQAGPPHASSEIEPSSAGPSGLPALFLAVLSSFFLLFLLCLIELIHSGQRKVKA